MKPKQILFTALFSIITFAGTCQNKFDYAVIELDLFKEVLCVSMNGEKHTENKVSVPERHNANLIISKIKELENEGWELVSLTNHITPNSAIDVYFAYLRRPRKE